MLPPSPRVSPGEEEVKLPLIYDEPDGNSSRVPQRRRKLQVIEKLGYTLLGATVGIPVFYLSQQPHETFVNERDCIALLSPYSPALEAVRYEEKQWANDFDAQDIYRGSPTPEREKAWNELWSMGDIVVKLSELPFLNKSSEATMKLYRPELGGIAANLEVFHQLHCLDMIRRYTYLDSYTPATLPDDFVDVPAQYLREHVDHCITTLRLAITCAGDVAPILMARDPENIKAVLPDMRTTHKCRRFDDIRDWFIGKSYTDWDCIQRGGSGCDIIPDEFKKPEEKDVGI